MSRAFLLVLVVLTLLRQPASAQVDLQVAELGECPLESGEVLQDCRVAYRTFGELDSTQSNAVLFTTGAGETTANLAEYIGPDGWVDDSEYFVIAVDAFGNGVSSSPSNSTVQPDSAFPRIAIRDMVASQHRLLTEVLGLSSVRAVIGGSMGGMQAFEWAVSYPEFAEKVISIEGTPRLAAFDLVLWETVLRILEVHEKCQCREAVSIFGNLLFFLMGYSPEYHARMTPRDSVPSILGRMAEIPLTPWAPNLASQIHAGLDHNVAAPYDDSLERAASIVQAEVLVIVTPMDHLATPGPSLEFANLLGAETLILSSDCGHLGIACDNEEISAAVQRFLARRD